MIDFINTGFHPDLMYPQIQIVCLLLQVNTDH